MVEIICKNCDTIKQYPIGTRLSEIATDMQVCLKQPILAALVNNKLKELTYQVFKPKTIQFIDVTHHIGIRVYIRSLAFVLFKAIKEIHPSAELSIEHAVSKGWYCDISNSHLVLDDQTIALIKTKMQEIIDLDIPFIRKEILTTDAIKLFDNNGLYDKSILFKTRNQLYSSVYHLGDTVNYFYGYLVPSTGHLKKFNIVKYFNGILLQVPKQKHPDEIEEIVIQNKMFKIFREHKKWCEILEVPYVGSLNNAVIEKKDNEFIKISEALHEKKIAKIADNIFKRRNEARLILISGPSSSGKTTFSMRLSVQLRVLGFKTVQISLDNYFVNREFTPKDENGDYDFECIEALDIEQFNKDLLELMDGNEVEIPKFDFITGKRFYDNTMLKISKDSLIIVEGIHGLNSKLTHLIEEKLKYRIFVSALTQLAIDKQNPIPTTDNRLIRRIVRDYRTRGYSALETLRRWESVRNGEELNIFPYQENADTMFNSALLYELAVLKTFADPILKAVPENVPEYAEAVRLQKFISYFLPISEREIPPTSILREFLGGSSFVY
ncbi:MAG: Flp pilus assembly complex ATPase component TadA [Bacteroidetes bacterium]|nr:Flp pilus assembly complex ATPase component TadA [Bacteroidota bacterium]